MRETNRRWVFALAWCVAVVLLTACASGRGFTLPPVTITLPADTPAPTEPEPPRPRATLAFEVLDDETGAPIADAFVRIGNGLPPDGQQKQTDATGYAAFELEAGGTQYETRFLVDDTYESPTRFFTLNENAQHTIRLKRDGQDVRPLVNLNIVVHDAAGAGIAGAACIVRGPNTGTGVEQRIADGAGFLNFAVRGSVETQCRAAGFDTAVRELPPGDHRFPLARVAVAQAPKPDPPPVTPQKPGGIFVQCGAGDNTLRISTGCLAAVSAQSPRYLGCQQGSRHDCHYFVREVALALRDAQADPRWGLIRKTAGGQNVDGYGEDVVAYLPAPLPLDVPTWRWRGADIVGGAGAPGARFQGGELHPAIPCSQRPDGTSWCNRETDVWAPVSQ